MNVDENTTNTMNNSIHTNNNNENKEKIANEKKEGVIEKKEEPVKTLDSLFMKTNTLPHIYYLPLTEEQVKEKLNKQNRK